jgi:hypothetical protein
MRDRMMNKGNDTKRVASDQRIPSSAPPVSGGIGIGAGSPDEHRFRVPSKYPPFPNVR